MSCLSTGCSKHRNYPGEAIPNDADGHWKIILSRSCFINDAESCYASVEDESLALLVYGIESCRMFILELPDFLVTADHQQLIISSPIRPSSKELKSL